MNSYWRRKNLANRNPARIPPQTPPAGGKSVEAKRKILFPRKKLFRFAESVLKPHHLPEALRAESRKKCSHPFRRKNRCAPNQKSGEHFFAGHASGASGGGAIHSAILKIGASLVK